MKGIPGSVKSNFLWIVLLKDIGDYALYFNKTDNCFAGFEVHKIRIREAQECDIKQKNGSVYHLSVPRRRVVAGNEDFGRFAWHYPNLTIVYKKFPKFKKHSHEIENKLDDALITVKKRISRVYVDKTDNTRGWHRMIYNSHPSSQLSYYRHIGKNTYCWICKTIFYKKIKAGSNHHIQGHGIGRELIPLCDGCHDNVENECLTCRYQPDCFRARFENCWRFGDKPVLYKSNEETGEVLKNVENCYTLILINPNDKKGDLKC